VLAMALAVQFAVPAKVVLRGPGQWLPLSEAEAFARSKDRAPGRYLDSGTWLGLGTFAVSCALFVGGACALFPRAPYQALLLLLGSPCLLPLFFTGRAAQLPADLATRPRALLCGLAKQLRRAEGIKVVPWARIPEAARDADELRLLIQVPGALRGLLGIEVGVEYTAGIGGSAAALFVLVRAREGSQAVNALPRDVIWTRGRKAEERATVLRPRLPTRGDCAKLVLELVSMLREAEPAYRSRNSAPSAASKAVAQVNAASPAHVL